MQRTTLVFALAFLLEAAHPSWAADKGPTFLRTPNGGIQPQAAIDSQGTLHLIYYKGKPEEGDVFYVKREAGKERFSEPIRVNSQPGSAVAMGTIRGGQLALGKNGRVHVAWNGSGKAAPKAANQGSPMLYSRMDDAGKAFEEQRNLMQQTFGLDGGGTVAADNAGNVYVAWHGLKVGSPNGEENRQVWLARSTDEGKTFARETAASTQPTGVCGCCAMKAFADSKGTLHLLYRSATAKVNRDIYLLTSKDQGKSFQSELVSRWNVNGCPMSLEALAEGGGNVLAAWETTHQVYFARIEPGADKPSKPIAAPGAGKDRKLPAVAANGRGETLLVWAEGTGWQRGGALAWQVFDASGKPTTAKGRIDGGVPVWGLPAAASGPDGEIVVVH